MEVYFLPCSNVNLSQYELEYFKETGFKPDSGGVVGRAFLDYVRAKEFAKSHREKVERARTGRSGSWDDPNTRQDADRDEKSKSGSW